MAIAQHDLLRKAPEHPGRLAPRENPTKADPSAPFDGKAPTPTVDLSSPESLVHCLLFVLEYSASGDLRWKQHRRNLNLFFSRAGGVHLLLMLLNAYYHKPLAGRRPGWVFRGLRDRIEISERALRMLIRDAVQEGLIVQQPSEKDRRCHSYRLTKPVIDAWEGLTLALGSSLPGALGQLDPGALANIDYRCWDPNLPASDQVDDRPPSRRR